MRYRVIKSVEFVKWFEIQTDKTKVIISARLDRISIDGHFGLVHHFDGLLELKWKSGIRVYTFIYQNKLVVLLYGGNKNGQDKDIREAKKIKQAFFCGTYPID